MRRATGVAAVGLMAATLAAGCGGDDGGSGSGDSAKSEKPAFTAAEKRQASQLVMGMLLAEIDKHPEKVCAALSPAGLKRLQASSTTSRFCKPLVMEATDDPGNSAGSFVSEHAGAIPGFVNPDVEANEVSIIESAEPDEAKAQMESWNSQVAVAGRRLLVSFGNTPNKTIPVVKTAKGLKVDSLAADSLPASFTAPSRRIAPCLQRGLRGRTTDLQREMERDDENLGPVAYYSFELGQDQKGEGGGALVIRVAESEAAAEHVVAQENAPRGEVDEVTGELSREVPDPLPAARYGSLVASRTNDTPDENDAAPKGGDLALIKRCGKQAGLAGL